MQISFSYVGGYCAFPRLHCVVEQVFACPKVATPLHQLQRSRPAQGIDYHGLPPLQVPSSVMPRAFPALNEVLVEGGERQFPAQREFQIGSVVQGESVALSEPSRSRPCLVSGFRVQRDGQVAQKVRKALSPFSVKAPS